MSAPVTAATQEPTLASMGAIDLAATMAAYADGWEDRVHDLNWKADEMRRRWALNQELYWDRMDRERAR